MGEKRGFHFLVGLAALWFLWRLYAAGIIFQTVALVLGPESVACYCDDGNVVASGPGAIIVAVIIEAVITIGWVITLAVSGIWDGLLVLGRFIGDGFGAAHGYVKGAQTEATPVVTQTTRATADTRQLTPEQQAIETLSKQLVELSKRLPPEPEVTA